MTSKFTSLVCESGRVLTFDDSDDQKVHVLRNSSTINSQPSRPKFVARFEISLSAAAAFPVEDAAAAAAAGGGVYTKHGGKPWKRCPPTAEAASRLAMRKKGEWCIMERRGLVVGGARA